MIFPVIDLTTRTIERFEFIDSFSDPLLIVEQYIDFYKALDFFAIGTFPMTLKTPGYTRTFLYDAQSDRFILLPWYYAKYFNLSGYPIVIFKGKLERDCRVVIDKWNVEFIEKDVSLKNKISIVRGNCRPELSGMFDNFDFPVAKQDAGKILYDFSVCSVDFILDVKLGVNDILYCPGCEVRCRKYFNEDGRFYRAKDVEFVVKYLGISLEESFVFIDKAVDTGIEPLFLSELFFRVVECCSSGECSQIESEFSFLSGLKNGEFMTVIDTFIRVLTNLDKYKLEFVKSLIKKRSKHISDLDENDRNGLCSIYSASYR